MSDWLEKWKRQRAAQERRVVPLPVFEKSGNGYCRWCGGEIIHREGKREGYLNTRRSWHDGRGVEPDCLHEFYLHSRRDTQFNHVEGRDGLKCWDCGESPERWQYDRLKGGRAIECGGFFPWPDPRDARIEYVGQFCRVERVTALELEHETPIWSVAHLPDDERRSFFGPSNLRLRCPVCHKAKTAREAATRAAARRAA